MKINKGFLICLFLGILLSSFVVAQDATPIQQQATQAQAPQVAVPQELKDAARFIFNLDAGAEIEFSFFVILVVIFLGILLLVTEIVSFMSFFEGGSRWLAGIVITLLVSVSGGLKQAANFIWGFADIFKAVDKWGIVKLFFVILIIAILVFGVIILLEMLRKKVRKEERHWLGFNLKFRK